MDVNKTYRLGSETVQRIKDAAEEYGMSMRAVIEESVAEWCARKEEREEGEADE